MRNLNTGLITVLAVAFTSSVLVQARTMESLEMKTQAAALALEEIVQIPDHSIPISLLQKAVCIATIPNVKKAGFVFGGLFGQGLVSCRANGGWSSPSFLNLVGGSWGFQAGIASVDMILIFVNPNAVTRLSVYNFTLGSDASIVTGPVGRDLQINTDYSLTSEIYSYSRAKGLFAGVSFAGTSVSVDKKSNSKVYGAPSHALSLLSTRADFAPLTVAPYVRALNQVAQ